MVSQVVPGFYVDLFNVVFSCPSCNEALGGLNVHVRCLQADFDRCLMSQGLHDTNSMFAVDCFSLNRVVSTNTLYYANLTSHMSRCEQNEKNRDESLDRRECEQLKIDELWK